MGEKVMLKKLNDLLACKTFEEIMALIYEILGSPALIIDMNHNILAYTQVPVQNKFWQKIVIDREMTRQIIDGDIRLMAEHAAAFRTDQAIFLNNTFGSETQIKKALVCDGKKLGLLMVIPDTRPLTEADRVSADIVGNILAWKMLSHNGLLLQKDAQKNTFFSSLLDGKQYTQQQIALWLSTMNITFKKHLYIAACSAPKTDAASPSILRLDLDAFSACACGPAFLYASNLILILNFDEPAAHPESELPELETLLIQNKMQMGISTYFEKLADVPMFYHQAQQALKLGQMLFPARIIHSFDQLVIYDIIRQLPAAVLPTYIHPDIMKLKGYDDANHTALCPTLLAYLNYNNSLTKTSEALFVHKNTVNYRIRQCGEILHSNFKEGHKNFIYVFSLSILTYLNNNNKFQPTTDPEK